MSGGERYRGTTVRRSIALGLALMSTAALAQTVTGPIEGRPTLGQNTFDAAPAGYVVQEFFLAGSARAYRWAGGVAGSHAEEAGLAPYRTRIVVARPASPAHFNGTVVVEWLNVSAGTDGAPDWTYTHRELLRKGFAYVAVSAQKVGIDGSPMGIPGLPPLKKADPARYAVLNHPGDAYAYDIFSQAARTVREGKVLGPLKPKSVIATGESQSAAFLTTYVNAVDPISHAFDGYLIHSRFGGMSPLDGDIMTSMATRASAPLVAVPIRADVRVPVLMFITETDLMTPNYGYLAARQSDAPHIRTWEVAGTAHADSYTLAAGAIDTGHIPIEQLAQAYAPVDNILGMKLTQRMNSAPQHHYVMQAALASLDRWVRTGKAPPQGAPLSVAPGAEPALVPDAQGNATGGIRSPWVDVPTAVLSGLGQDGPGLTRLFGSTRPFNAEMLAKLYPGGKSDYLAKFQSALRSSIAAGFILPEDETEIMALAGAMYPSS